MFKLLERKFEHLNPFKPNGISTPINWTVVRVGFFLHLFKF